MKKIVSLVLAISMVMSMFVSAFAASTTFEDVTDPNCAGAVEALVELGVVNGMPDGTFAPASEVTRAQLAKMLVLCTGLVEGMDEDSAEEYFNEFAAKKVFNDVEGHWGAGYINAAAQLKLISGYPDGSFKPNKNVSYAEAITMMIRALGYGNVVDAEGTWPVAYTAKARELGLYDNVKGAIAGEAASRGNIAILLWNMLTTPMWRILEESEGNGMTSSADGAIMLNIKFPDYKYVENAIIESITVADQDVTIVLDDGSKDGVKALANGQYLPHLLLDMEVTALVKDWKDADEATFLTLTPANTVVEGLVTKTTETRITIEDTAYRFDSAEDYEDLYVVAEIEGSKVLNIAVLPETFVEVEDLRTMENAIDEDALVIIDGEWATRDDIEEGNVYTEFNDQNNTEADGTYYVVATERVEGEFESLTVENTETERTFLEVDGEEYRVNSLFQAWEEEENDEEVEPSQLKAPAEDNKFLGAEVELVLNYLGQAVRANFGEVPELNAGGDFYAVVSNGIWTASSSEGEVEYIKLVGLDGEEETYTLSRSASASLEEALENKAVYTNAERTGKATFVYAKFNDEGEVKSIKVLAEGDFEDYTVAAFSAYEDRYFDGDTAHRVLDSTVVFKVAPEVHEEDGVEYVTGFDVEVLEGTEALNGVEGDFYAYDRTSIAQRVKFVFVSDDAKSDFNYGLVEETDHRAGKFFITINGEEYEFDEEAYEDVLAEMLEKEVTFDYDEHLKVLYGKLVAFTELDGKVTVEKYLEPSDLDNGENGAAIVLGKDKEDSKVVVLDKQVPGSAAYTDGEDLNGYAIDLSTEDNDTVVNAYSKFTFLKAKATIAKEGNKVEFSSEVEDLGRGIENVTVNKADRLVIDEDNHLVVIVTIATVKADDVIKDGVLQVPAV